MHAEAGLELWWCMVVLQTTDPIWTTAVSAFCIICLIDYNFWMYLVSNMTADLTFRQITVN